MTESIEEIRGRERVLVTAILERDIATIETVISPEFVYTASEIGRRTREQWLEGIASYRLDIFEILEMTIEPYGETAVVQACIRQDATIHELDREGLFLITDVWIRQDSAWRLVTRSSIADQP